jgi:cell pole-organizing protein PopZ
MTQPAKAQEPSMEEILASIRRIIADDDATKTVPAAESARPAPPPQAVPSTPKLDPGASNSQDDIDALFAKMEEPPEAEPANDILDLTEAMERAPPPPQSAAPPSPPPQPSARAPSAAARSAFRTIDGESDVVFNEAAEPVRAPEPAPKRPIVDEARRRFNQESDRALLSPSTSAAVDSAFGALAQTVLVQNARTLEDLVREMLRPMLKAWLDDNLPHMVERMVRAEIERVSRGRT